MLRSLHRYVFPVWDSFSNLGTVVSPRQEHVTKDLPYLKEMIPREVQKTDIPGLVAGIVIVITTIVIMVITIKV